MSHRVFHKEYRQEPCGNRVDFFGSTFFDRFPQSSPSDFAQALSLKRHPIGDFSSFSTTLPTLRLVITKN